jgi:hypothetical protein
MILCFLAKHGFKLQILSCGTCFHSSNVLWTSKEKIPSWSTHGKVITNFKWIIMTVLSLKFTIKDVNAVLCPMNRQGKKWVMLIDWFVETHFVLKILISYLMLISHIFPDFFCHILYCLWWLWCPLPISFKSDYF